MTKEGNESLLLIRLVNRNPRNLEHMLMESKPMGFELEKACFHYWNKYCFACYYNFTRIILYYSKLNFILLDEKLILRMVRYAR